MRPVTRAFAGDERGAVLVQFAMCITLLLLLLALAIDLSFARLIGNRLQITADAAATASVVELPVEADVDAVALQYAQLNYPEFSDDPVLVASDVVPGHWTGSAFIAGGFPLDAVRVTTRRQARNNNPVSSFFAGVAGIDFFQLQRSAVAIMNARQLCEGGGIFSDTNVESGSNNDYLADFCLYGRDWVQMGSNNTVAPGAIIGMRDPNDFEEGSDNVGTDEALRTMDETLPLPGLVSGLITSMQDSRSGLPSFITDGPVYLSEITDSTPLEPGTLYVVSGVADFGSDRDISNIAVVAEKEIKLGSNSELSNAIFVTPDKILFGSYITVGGTNPCASSEYNVYLFSRSDIEFGSNNDLAALQIAAQGELNLGSDIVGITNLYAEALGAVEYGSSESYGSCGGGLSSSFGSLVISEQDGGPYLVQ